jgi:hypothetical protein
MTEMTVKDYAKMGFDDFLASSDKEFPFEFEDVWLFMEQKRAKELWQERIMTLKKEIDIHEDCLGDNMLPVVMPVNHSFTEKQYIREFRAPANHTIVSKIHNTNYPLILLEGDVTIVEKDGTKRVKAPYYSITEVGTMRAVVVHQDCYFITVHISEATNIVDAEKEIFAKTFDDVKVNPKDSCFLEKFIEELRNSK